MGIGIAAVVVDIEDRHSIDVAADTEGAEHLEGGRCYTLAVADTDKLAAVADRALGQVLHIFAVAAFAFGEEDRPFAAADHTCQAVEEHSSSLVLLFEGRELRSNHLDFASSCWR